MIEQTRAFGASRNAPTDTSVWRLELMVRCALLLLFALALAACGSSSKTGTVDNDAVADQIQPESDTAVNDVGSDGFTVVVDFVTPPDLGEDATPDGLGEDVVPWNPSDGAMVYFSFQSFTSETFFDYPWPESRRYDDDGTIALAGFPNPVGGDTCTFPSTDDPTIKLLINAIRPYDFRQYIIDVADRTLRDFAPNAAAYLRFSGPIDTARLPTPSDSMQSGAHLFLINVEESSPRRGQRLPISTRFFTTSRYLPTYTLATMPFPGFPMAPNEHHALVVLRSLQDKAGVDLKLSPEFEKLKDGTGDDAAQNALYGSVFTYLETLGVPRAQIAAMTVFRVGDPVQPLRDVVEKVLQLPATTGAVVVEKAAFEKDYYSLTGTLSIPNYQRGVQPILPHVNISKLRIEFDPDDHSGELLPPDDLDLSETPDPQKPRLETVHFRLTVPVSAINDAKVAGDKKTLPLPLVIYGHGTGGDRSTFVNNGTATELASLGIAVLSIDAVAHGERIDPENMQADLKSLLKQLGQFDYMSGLLTGGMFFYNFASAYAGDGNVQQSALDYIWLASLFTRSELSAPTDTPVTVVFDPAKTYYMGHSQGATTGPLTVLSPDIKANFFSAGGGHLIMTALTKGDAELLTIKEVVAYGVCDPQLDEHHPMLTMLQAVGEPSDPLNYAPYFAKWPHDAGFRHIYLTEGTKDTAVTPPANEALSTAAGLQLVGTELKSVIGQQLLGITPSQVALKGNLQQGTITAGFRQFTCGGNCGEDHFVAFYVPEAMSSWHDFFASLLSDGIPTIPATP
ncbi:MAG: hypothetical protein KC609_19995 [Myxococcales bacterium]|nr:hypothetical protein [Myxococcales bacterium]